MATVKFKVKEDKKKKPAPAEVSAQNDSPTPHEELNRIIKEMMGRRSATTIAKNCGVKSVSTITRIRNGENKRGVSEELLRKIWENRDPSCDIELNDLLSINQAVFDANRKKADAEFEQDRKEIDFLEMAIEKSMFDSEEAFLRKVKNMPYEIIPDVELYPEMTFEVLFEKEEKRRIFFFTQFYASRRIERREKLKAEDPTLSRSYCRHYRTIMDFQEMRILHPKYKNTELVIAFNYEDDFRYNIDTLKKLSNKENVTLALMDSDSGKLLEEACLDGRKKGILRELNLV